MRKSFKPAMAAALFAVAAAGPAFAGGDGGDNGMTPWYGDSWAGVQSRQAQETAVPSLQAQEEKAPARAAWAQEREAMRARTAQMRDSTSRALHRLTGTATTADDRAAPAARDDTGTAHD